MRVDFEFQRASQIAGLESWPNSPTSVEAMVLYDASGGRVTASVRRLVGKSLRPDDMPATFEQVCGDFWYYPRWGQKAPGFSRGMNGLSALTTRML